MEKFFQGNVVKVADKMPKEMSHFRSGGYAVIDHRDNIHSNDAEPEYGIFFFPQGDYHAWYQESLLTLATADQRIGNMLLKIWKGG